MGVPAFFRWLSQKYPKTISSVFEEHPIKIDGQDEEIPVDIARPNPNGEEFDNLYLDMNGIVHPCARPEGKPPPSNEDEMMWDIFKYTERVVNIARPRKILFLAVDGVAPRAKMNQQRSRRFRSVQERKKQEEDKIEFIKMLKAQNKEDTRDGLDKEADAEQQKLFDTNAITPGTPFMNLLARSLRYWVTYKLSTDPAWAKLKVILSDASVPGEGEHKIIGFIRSQRKAPDYDPNTKHVIYGLDADLIMLCLGTHEPHFRVLREDVFFQESQSRTCRLCGQGGHLAESCRGRRVENPASEVDEQQRRKSAPLRPFLWLNVSILREYLQAELFVPYLPFRWDFDRSLDDWIFLCFFVGNDFLPHLPALEIREGAIDTLTSIWRDALPTIGGYVTEDGDVDLGRAQHILSRLGMKESGIFRNRKEVDDRRERRFKKSKRESDQQRDGFPAHRHPPQPFGLSHGQAERSQNSVDNGALNSELISTSTPGNSNRTGVVNEITSKTGHNLPPAKDNSSAAAAEEPRDTVMLWEQGYADRYYKQKFHVGPENIEFRYKVARDYAIGISWVMRYYFQDCPSWDWFYPHHYAPFAADFVHLDKFHVKFDDRGIPARPYEQLMSVMPPASRHTIPEVFHCLMTEADSEIIDFYPETFKIDMNGKKMSHQGVALLPFIEEKRLKAAMNKKYPLLSPEERMRNEPGKPELIFSTSHPLYEDVAVTLYSKRRQQQESTTTASPMLKLEAKKSDGLFGTVEKNESHIPGTMVPLACPLSPQSTEGEDRVDIEIVIDHSIILHYERPTSPHVHKSMLLRGVKLPPPVLTQVDIDIIAGNRRSSRDTPRYHGPPSFNSYDHDHDRMVAGNKRPRRGTKNYYYGSNNQMVQPGPCREFR